MKDQVFRYLSKDKMIRVSIVQLDDLLQAIYKELLLSPLANLAYVRNLLSCLLLASQRDDESFSILFDGDGPLGRVYAEVNAKAHVRAYVGNPVLEQSKAVQSLPQAIGKGLMTVTRLAQNKKPYRGTVEIQSGEITQDVSYYLKQSEQIPSLLILGQTLKDQRQITKAGGILFELMPGHSEYHIQTLESILASDLNLSELLEQDLEADQILKLFSVGFVFDMIDQGPVLKYQCDCNQNKVLRALALLPEEDYNSLFVDKDSLSVNCDFCQRSYRVRKEDFVEYLKKQ